jgi:hypothetical protein
MSNQDGTALIPLMNRRGVPSAYTKVDEADLPMLRLYRWWRDGRYVAGKLLDGTGGVVRMHRLLLGLTETHQQADHINRDPLDNRRQNLRTVDQAQNNQNCGFDRRNKSGYRGVHWSSHRQRWIATCRLDGRKYTLGQFTDPAEAGRVAAAFRARHMPYSEDALQKAPT